jgi:hypothetical protein
MRGMESEKQKTKRKMIFHFMRYSTLELMCVEQEHPDDVFRGQDWMDHN